MIDNKLKTFVAVVEAKSYTQAAEILHMTQPAVSQHVKALEDYYDTSLIASPHKGLTLTKAGKKLYEYAKIQIHNEKMFIEQLEYQKTNLSIGATLSIADYYLPQVLAQHITSEKQNYNIIVGNTSTLINKMINGEVNCAFVEGQFDVHLFDYHLFHNARFVLVAKKGHPLQNKELSFEELLDFPLFIREQGSGTRGILETYLKHSIHDIQSFHHIIEIGSMTMIKQFLTQTEGISFLYEGVVREELDKGSLVELHLKDFKLTRPMNFIYLKSDINASLYKNFYKTIIENSL